jgi:Zn-dependent peptidase ImmA (M78 family)/transcriptional regulator with XRE-family HTH domain
VATSREEIAARVRSGIDRLQMTQQDLARLVGLDPTALSRALHGQRDFKSVEIARIASALELPVGYLLGDDIADPSANLKVAARVQSASSVDLSQAMKSINTVLAVDQLLDSCDLPAASLSAITIPKEPVPWLEGQKLTDEFRTKVRIAQDFIPPIDFTDFALWIEGSAGIDVIFGAVPQGVDGISVAQGDFKLIMVNTETPATRRRWTIAHELGHLVAGDTQDLRVDYNIYRRSPEEQRANSFAANLLLPAPAVCREWILGGQDENHITNLVQRFGVSLEALAYRLHNTGCVNAAGRDAIRSVSVLPRAESTLAHSSLGERRFPMNLLHRAFEGYRKGETSVMPIADILGLPAETALSVFESPADEAEAMSEVGDASAVA